MKAFEQHQEQYLTGRLSTYIFLVRKIQTLVKMVYRNTNRALNEEVDSLKKKMKTLEEINKDMS